MAGWVVFQQCHTDKPLTTKTKEMWTFFFSPVNIFIEFGKFQKQTKLRVKLADRVKCGESGSSLCCTARNYIQQKLLSISFFDGGQWSESESGVKCEEAKSAFIAALALPMQIFIRKASDSIVTVLLALQWLSVHPCYREIGWNYILFMLG